MICAPLNRWFENLLLMGLNCIDKIAILFASANNSSSYCTRMGVKENFAGSKKVKIFRYITSSIMNWGYFDFDQMGPFKIGGSFKAMFLLVGLLLDVFERLRIDWHKIGPDLRESLRSKCQIWLFQRQVLVIILSVLPKTRAWSSLILPNKINF